MGMMNGRKVKDQDRIFFCIGDRYRLLVLLCTIILEEDDAGTSAVGGGRWGKDVGTLSWDIKELLLVFLLLFEDFELIVKATRIGSSREDVEEFSNANLNCTPGGWFLIKFISL